MYIGERLVKSFVEILTKSLVCDFYRLILILPGYFFTVIKKRLITVISYSRKKYR